MTVSRRTLLAAGVVAASAGTFSAVKRLPRCDHLVVIIDEKHSLSQVAKSPYLASLASRGAFFRRSFTVAHPSQPDYLASFSGSTRGVGDDEHYDLNGPKLALSFDTAEPSSIGYGESLPRTGFCGNRAGDHGGNHPPWANFTNVPQTANKPLIDFPIEGFAALATVCVVIPNLRNGMHEGCVAARNTWRQVRQDDYARWAMGHNSLLVATFDEGPGYRSPATTPIATAAVGAHAKPGASDQPITHRYVLRTAEDFYGQRSSGDGGSATRIAGIWH